MCLPSRRTVEASPPGWPGATRADNRVGFGGRAGPQVPPFMTTMLGVSTATLDRPLQDAGVRAVGRVDRGEPAGFDGWNGCAGAEAVRRDRRSIRGHRKGARNGPLAGRTGSSRTVNGMTPAAVPGFPVDGRDGGGKPKSRKDTVS